MELIYVEGLPCAGKSTLLKKMETQKYKVLHELGRILSKEEFPGNGKNKEEICDIDMRFIDKESQRYGGIFYDEKNFFDRSFFTHLSYAYAYSQYTKIDSFQDTVLRYKQALDQKKIFIPDCLILINISSTISIERQLAKIQENPQKALPEFWRNKTFLDNSSLAYAKLSSCFNGKITIIDGQLSTDDKLKQISGLNNEKILEKQLDLDAYLSLF